MSSSACSTPLAIKISKHLTIAEFARRYNLAMRRSLAIAALGAVLLVPPIWGQMRAGPRMAAPMGRPGFVSRSPVFVRGGFAFGRNPRFQVFFNENPFFFHNCFFHRCAFSSQPFFFPVAYGGYSYPIVIQTAQPSDYSDNRREMAREIERLSDEVERLREEQESRHLPPSPPPRPQVEKKSEPSAPTVLVFRDKHIQEVHNFAIVGQTLWVFNERRATRVPLSSLDVDATTRLNDERGVEFRLPK